MTSELHVTRIAHSDPGEAVDLALLPVNGLCIRSDPDPRHFAAVAAELAPATAVRLTVPGERTPVP
jgi:L-ascorbate metabolism protein UlaG (beta-lactamase superfamily)